MNTYYRPMYIRLIIWISCILIELRSSQKNGVKISILIHSLNKLQIWKTLHGNWCSYIQRFRWYIMRNLINEKTFWYIDIKFCVNNIMKCCNIQILMKISNNIEYCIKYLYVLDIIWNCIDYKCILILPDFFILFAS